MFQRITNRPAPCWTAHPACGRPSIVWLAAALTFATAHAWAQTNAPAPPPPTDTPPAVTNRPHSSGWTRDAITTIDAGHGKVSQLVVLTFDSVDRWISEILTTEPDEMWSDLESFFGEGRPNLEPEKVILEVTPGIRIEESEGIDPRAEYRLRVDLPRTEDRLQLIAESFDPENRSLEEFGGRAPVTGYEEVDSIFGLRANVLNKTRFRASLDAGLKFKPEPRGIFKARLTATRTLGDYRVTLSEIGFWEDGEGFGEKTRLDIHRPIGTTWHLRGSASAVLREESEDGMEMGTSATLTKALPRNRRIGLRCGVTYITEPAAAVDKYILRIPYRQRLYRDWLYGELEPGVDFPNEEEFDPVPILNARLDILFGKLPTR